MVIESNASPSIKGEGVGVTIKVTGDNLVLSTAQDALEGALWCLLHYLLDVIIFGSFLQVAGQSTTDTLGVGTQKAMSVSPQG